MLGKTNATTGGSSGGAVGGEIEVINKTGSNIAIDDKVWINEIIDADWSTYAHTYLNELSVGNMTNVDLFRYDFTVTELDAGGSNYTGGTAPLITSSSGNVIGVYVNGVNKNNTIYLVATRGNGSTWDRPGNTSSRITASLGDKISVRVKDIPGYGAYIIIYNLTTGLNTGTSGEYGSMRLGTRADTDLLVRMSNTWSSTFKLKFVADRIWFSKGGLEVVDYNPDETSIKQFWAVPFKNFNDKTLTGIAKTEAEDNKTLTAIIGGDVTEVYNQDKTITENGTYTADVGYTGLGTVTVNVKGGGDTVTAVNKTGAVINEGDKVWLQKDAQVGGEVYNIGSATKSELSSRLAYISRDGSWIWVANKIYNSEGTQTDTTQYLYADVIKYGDDNSIFVRYDNPSTSNAYGSSRCDPDGRYFLGNKVYFTGNNIGNTPGAYNSAWSVYTLNISNGSKIETWKSSSVGTSTNGYNAVAVFLDNGIKRVFCHTGGAEGVPQIWYLNDDKTITLKNWKRLEQTDKSVWYKYVTADKKFIIGAAGDGCLRLVEITNITEDSEYIKYYQKKDFPEDLKPYFDIDCRSVFNPYTGILTLTALDGSKRHLVARYTPEKGFERLPIYLGDYDIISEITFTDDLSKACFCVRDGTSARVVTIDTYSNYVGLPFTAVSTNTLTGKAKASAEIGAEVEVSTVLPNEVSVEVTAQDDGVTLSME